METNIIFRVCSLKMEQERTSTRNCYLKGIRCVLEFLKPIPTNKKRLMICHFCFMDKRLALIMVKLGAQTLVRV